MVQLTQQKKGISQRLPAKDQLLTVGDLDSFKEEMLYEIKLIVKESNGKPAKKWLKSTEVKKLLGISHGFLQTLRDTGTLPFTKIGGSLYYDYDDIQCMMEAKKCNHRDMLDG